MWKRKALMTLRVALVAVMVIAGLILGMGTAAAYSPEEKEGSDHLCSEASVWAYVDTDGDGVLDTEMWLILEGPMVVDRTPPPDPPEPPGGDKIDTEIVEMELTGSIPTIGTIKMKAGREFGLLPSIGAIEQQVPGTDYPAESFFDVFVELTGTPYGPLWNIPPEPCHVRAVITDPPGIPPYRIDYTSDIPVNLQDEGGTIRMQILVVRHTPLPCPPVPGITGWGIMAAVIVLGAVAVLMLRRRQAHQS